MEKVSLEELARRGWRGKARWREYLLLERRNMRALYDMEGQAILLMYQSYKTSKEHENENIKNN